MSVLNHIKGIILAEIKSTTPDLKKAIVKVINAIDSDLDVAGYEQSSDVDTALLELERTLCDIDESIEELTNNKSDEELINVSKLKKIQRDETETEN